MIDKDRIICAYPEYEELRESTTFWDDFSIADAFGCDAIKDTFQRAFNEWKSYYKYLTELVAVLNHKIWYWYEMEGESSEKAILYNELWLKADGYALNNLKGDELKFFIYVID